MPQPDDATTLETLRQRRQEILAVVAKHGALNLRVYGTVARGEATWKSDVDVLVDIEDGRSLLDLAALHLELEDMLGFRVEIATDVRPRFRDRVHAEAVIL